MEHETGSTAGEFLRLCELFGFFKRGAGTKKLYSVVFQFPKNIEAWMHNGCVEDYTYGGSRLSVQFWSFLGIRPSSVGARTLKFSGARYAEDSLNLSISRFLRVRS
jgi:hypothetical protein